MSQINDDVQQHVAAPTTSAAADAAASPLQDADNVWYYGAIDAETGTSNQLGPVMWSALADLKDDILVWSSSMTEWQPLGDVRARRKEAEEKKAAKAAKRKRTKKKPPNSSVYITWQKDEKTGQFADLSKDEIVAHFTPYGIIKTDPETNEPMVRVYEDESGACKGDAIVHYFQPLSAETAIENLDQSMIRPGLMIHCEKATFSTHGSEVKKPKLLPAQVAINRKLRQAKIRELTGWDDDPTRSAGLRIVILKHMFSPEEAEGDKEFYNDLEREIGLECQRIGGPIEKLTIFRGSPIGAVCVKFKEGAGAEKCIQVMDGRWFAERRIEAEWFDGVTNYKVEETEDQQKKRIEEFGEWLEDS